jgi:glutaredoxin
LRSVFARAAHLDLRGGPLNVNLPGGFLITMTKLLSILAIVLALAGITQAAAPKPSHDLRLTLAEAAKQQKFAFVLLGRPGCVHCAATKALIREGKIPVAESDYVMADLNAEEEASRDGFMYRYGSEKFGDELPYVVITDSKGKALAATSGERTVEQWNALLARARGKNSGWLSRLLGN